VLDAELVGVPVDVPVIEADTLFDDEGLLDDVNDAVEVRVADAVLLALNVAEAEEVCIKYKR
jgi:hypothetical protein